MKILYAVPVARVLGWGIQLLMLGIIGEYIGRIYEEPRRRPSYVLAKTQKPA